MGTRFNTMLEFTEQVLAGDFTIIPASRSVPTDDFQAIAGEQRDAGLPEFKGQKMQLLSKDRKELIKQLLIKRSTCSPVSPALGEQGFRGHTSASGLIPCFCQSTRYLR